MTIIPLDRRFVEWRDRESPPPGLRFGSAYGLLSWENLLAKRRVVVLAEAGSGKTAEMEEPSFRLQTRAGKFAFHATVGDVGRESLDGAIRPNGWSSD